MKKADLLARKGGSLEQIESDNTYYECKTMIKAEYKKKWKQMHPNAEPNDPFHQMSRNTLGKPSSSVYGLATTD